MAKRRRKGTATDSIKKLGDLAKGYPTKDPKTGKVRVTAKPPKTTRGRPKASPSRSEASKRDMEMIQERQRIEKALGMERNIAQKKE